MKLEGTTSIVLTMTRALLLVSCLFLFNCRPKNDKLNVEIQNEEDNYSAQKDHSESPQSLSVNVNRALDCVKGANSNTPNENVSKILSITGLNENFFVVECSNINNAFATIHEEKRYIIYDPEFLDDFDKRSSNWSSLVILAHEIGHHLNGHIISNTNAQSVDRSIRVQQELESDEFAGFIAARMGAPLEEVIETTELFGAVYNFSQTHPPSKLRKEAIQKGYKKGLKDYQGNEIVDETNIRLEEEWSFYPFNGDFFNNENWRLIHLLYPMQKSETSPVRFEIVSMTNPNITKLLISNKPFNRTIDSLKNILLSEKRWNKLLNRKKEITIELTIKSRSFRNRSERDFKPFEVTMGVEDFITKGISEIELKSYDANEFYKNEIGKYILSGDKALVLSRVRFKIDEENRYFLMETPISYSFQLDPTAQMKLYDLGFKEILNHFLYNETFQNLSKLILIEAGVDPNNASEYRASILEYFITNHIRSSDGVPTKVYVHELLKKNGYTGSYREFEELLIQERIIPRQ